MKDVAQTSLRLGIILTLSAVAVSSLIMSSSATSSKKKKARETAALPPAFPADTERALPDGFTTNSFNNARGQIIYTIRLPRKTTSEPAKAMCIFTHGLADHCTRDGYLSLFENLSKRGVDCYAYDLHGHGRSGICRMPCYTEAFSDYTTDLLQYIKLCQKTYTDKDEEVPPLILAGQSMGGIISSSAVLRLGSDHVGGLMVTSPAFGVDMGLEMKIQKAVGPLLDRFLPTAKLVDAVRPEDMTRNKAGVEAYRNDPMCYPNTKLVLHTGWELSKSFDMMKSKRAEITCPVLILHGSGDRCTSINASRDFFQGIGTPEHLKQFIELPGLFHELLVEPEVERVMASLVEFAASAGRQFAEVEGVTNADGTVTLKL